jgi:hypothetical protein
LDTLKFVETLGKGRGGQVILSFNRRRLGDNGIRIILGQRWKNLLVFFCFGGWVFNAIGGSGNTVGCFCAAIVS